MNLIYAEFVEQTLAGSETQAEAASKLQELNGLLALESWSTPLSRSRPAPLPVEGPWWWRGDEDASASFFAGMGIDPDNL